MRPVGFAELVTAFETCAGEEVDCGTGVGAGAETTSGSIGAVYAPGEERSRPASDDMRSSAGDGADVSTSAGAVAAGASSISSLALRRPKPL